MAEHGPEERVATVEWGETDDRRSGWWDRILGRDGPRPGEPAGPAGPGGAASIGRLGVGLAAAGFCLLLAAEVLPWMRLSGAGSAGQLREQVGPQLSLGQLGTWEVLSYHFGWTALLVIACLAQVVPAPARRYVATAGVGLIAGQFCVLVGLTRAISDGGGLVGPSAANANPPVSYGEGMYTAFAALLLIGLAIGFAGRRPRQRPADRPPDAVDEVVEEVEHRGPADLTVTPLAPSEIYHGPAADRWSEE
jgi:hypothetical protein